MTCCPLTTSTATGGIRCGGSAFVDIAADVYDGLVFVLPLSEFADGTPDEYRDRTGNGLHGTGGNGSQIDLVPTQDLGVFCSLSQHTDGRQYITLPADGLSEQQSFTVSLWGKLSTFYQPRVWYSRGTVSAAGDQWAFAFGHSFLNTLSAQIQLLDSQGNATAYELRGATTLTQNVWYHVAAVWERSVGLRVYLDGVLDGSLAVSELSTVSVTNGGYLARWNDASIPTGNIQEVRLYPEPKSAAYLKAEHDNYCVSDFFEVGPEQDNSVTVT